MKSSSKSSALFFKSLILIPTVIISFDDRILLARRSLRPHAFGRRFFVREQLESVSTVLMRGRGGKSKRRSARGAKGSKGASGARGAKVATGAREKAKAGVKGAGQPIIQRECQHYLHTGTCKFGLSCRFSHQRTLAVWARAVHHHPLGPDQASKRNK